jgi:hypothetical protein
MWDKRAHQATFDTKNSLMVFFLQSQFNKKKKKTKKKKKGEEEEQENGTRKSHKFTLGVENSSMGFFL